MPDLSERSQQIQLMGDIYRQATYVVIWLGEGSDGDVADLYWVADSAASLGTSPVAAEVQDQLFNIVARTLAHPLFRRLWIYQEIALAREVQVQLGPSMIPLDNIMTVVQWFVGRRVSFPKDAWDTYLSLQRLSDQRRPPKLPELLYLLRRKACTDQRDRLFGAIQLLSRKERTACQHMLDYAKTSAEIFTELAILIVRSYDRFSILSINNVAYEHSDERPGDWPPMWNIEIYDHPLAPGVFFPLQLPIYQASHGLAPEWTAHLGGSTHEAPFKDNATAAFYRSFAIVVDAVVLSLDLAQLSSLEEILEELRPVIPEGHSLRQKLIRTILEDRFISTEEISRRIVPEDTQDGWETLEQEVARMALAAEKPRGNRISRHIFLTSDGHIGNGPRDTEPGDIVCLIPGADVPHVLRSIDRTIDDDGELIICMLIGECYLDEMMDGKIAENFARGQYELMPAALVAHLR